jgi:hypothetical protein
VPVLVEYEERHHDEQCGDHLLKTPPRTNRTRKVPAIAGEHLPKPNALPRVHPSEEPL